MSAVRTKNTFPELIVRRLLSGLGYRYRLHVANLPGRPDIVLRKRRCVIFVNGCFWHGHDCPRGKRPSSNTAFWRRKLDKNHERDRRVLKQLRKEDWRVLTVWGCDAKHSEKLKQRLRRFLDYVAANPG